MNEGYRCSPMRLPLGVATRPMFIALARSATTRETHWGATRKAVYGWGAVLGERSAAWLFQASDEQRRNAPHTYTAIPFIHSIRSIR